jgi:hypothetical protein
MDGAFGVHEREEKHLVFQWEDLKERKKERKKACGRLDVGRRILLNVS